MPEWLLYMVIMVTFWLVILGAFYFGIARPMADAEHRYRDGE